MALKLLPVTIGAAATVFSATSILCKQALVQAHRDNSAAAYVGDSNVDAATKSGIEVLPLADTQSPAIPLASGDGIIDLALLYADGTENNIVNVLYEEY